jgi:hypothetical protein
MTKAHYDNTWLLVEPCLDLHLAGSRHSYPATYFLTFNEHFSEGFIDHIDPLTYVCVYSKNPTHDTFKYHEARLEPDWDVIRHSAELEIRTLESMGTRKEVWRDVVPPGNRVFGGTWVIKHRRAPDGTIIKHISKCCVRRD